ncbi:hypothetical protein KY308_01840 [Candidatus Woesearchaeota archaeon]|nr:hypothetical protein [Candidatus Woesearchaeota archaeon]
MVSNVVRLGDKIKQKKNDPPKNNNPGERFAKIARTSGSIGVLAALTRGGIEENPTNNERQLAETMKEKIEKSKLKKSEKEKLMSYIELSEKKGTRGAVQRAGQVIKLYLDKDNVYGSETAIKTEIELMEAYANGEIEGIAKKVMRDLWGKPDRISKLWLKALNTALEVQIPENSPQRRESALFYVLKRYYYTTYPNSTEYAEDKLAEKIEGSIKVLGAW